MSEKKKKSIQTSFEDLKKKLDKKDDKEIEKKMENNIINLPLFDVAETPFYSQDYIEKKALFLPNSSRVNSCVVAKNENLTITMGKAGGKEEFGVLKTRHRDALYSILAIWAENNWTVGTNENGVKCGIIKTSRFRILSNMYSKAPCRKDYITLADSLHSLRAIPIELETLEEGDKKKEVFYIFSDYTLDEKKGHEEVVVFLNPKITKQYYKQEGLKLLFLSTYKSLSSDIAKTLYPIIDRVLSTKGIFKKNVVDLCNQNGLTIYRNNSDYRNKWKKAINELSGITLTNKMKVSVEFYENENKELILLAKPH